MVIKCPECDSEQITSKTSPSNGAQTPKTIVECLSCGMEWEPKNYDRLVREAALRKEALRKEAWKKEFYKAVETGDIVKAQILLDQSTELKNKFTNPKDAYKYLKKEGRMAIYIIIGCVVVIIIVFLFSAA